MNIKQSYRCFAPLVIASIVGLTVSPLAAQTEEEAINLVRSVIKADREEAVSNSLQLTDQEAKAFWPVYHDYRAEMDKVADGMVKLLREYAEVYTDVPDARAKQMLHDHIALQKQHAATRASYLKKIGKTLSAVKTLRFAQVENRMDLALQVKLASEIPLVPIEGDITGEFSGASVSFQGVPGRTVVQSYEVTASVAAIDRATRKVTIVDPAGIKITVKCGPEVVNFDQVSVGDQLKMRVTEQLVVEMADPAERTEHRQTALVALAPEGSKPGGIVAEATQVTAVVTALDPETHTATLQFEDGTRKTFPVRKDIDLAKRKVGEKVTFRLTESVAISVGKP